MPFFGRMLTKKLYVPAANEKQQEKVTERTQVPNKHRKVEYAKSLKEKKLAPTQRDAL